MARLAGCCPLFSVSLSGGGRPWRRSTRPPADGLIVARCHRRHFCCRRRGCPSHARVGWAQRPAGGGCSAVASAQPISGACAALRLSSTFMSLSIDISILCHSGGGIYSSLSRLRGSMTMGGRTFCIFAPRTRACGVFGATASGTGDSQCSAPPPHRRAASLPPPMQKLSPTPPLPSPPPPPTAARAPGLWPARPGRLPSNAVRGRVVVVRRREKAGK